MNRLVQRFQKLRAEKRAALIAYLTAGDPSLAETPSLVLEIARAGADVIELGVPFSDPSADGPVIQAAMERALSTGGAGHDAVGHTFEAVKQIRAKSDVPIVLFGYYNPLLQRGLGRVAKEAAAAGVDGLLVVDLPPEEAEELDAQLAAHELVRVPLLAPTTSPERARVIVQRGGGFAYYVALTGVTGAGHLDLADVQRRTRALRPSLGSLPLAVGFGIKDAPGARAIAGLADGVVIGSALVKTIADAPDAKARLAAAYQLTRTLADAITSAPSRVAIDG